ncbi:SIS domain-containing protein [Candidatus Margulisiibacteriota bacterium]
MDHKKDIKDYMERLKKILDKISVEEINNVMNVLAKAYEEDKQVLIMGNGGSAATASHFVCDFNKGVSQGKKKRFKFICLNDNVATMMAYANDHHYDDIFVETMKSYFHPGDVVIGISGSGDSKNILKAIEYANEKQGVTIGLTGYTGGKLKKLAQQGIHVPVEDMQIAEDLHLVLDHLMSQILCKQLK